MAGLVKSASNQSVSAGTTLATTFSSGSTAAGNHLQVVVVYYSTSARDVTITDDKSGGTQTYTANATCTAHSGSVGHAVFDLFSTASGVTTFTATFSVSGTPTAPSLAAASIHVRESNSYSALQTSNFALNPSPGAGAGAIAAGNVVPSSEPAWKVGFCFVVSGDAVGADAASGSGETKIWNFGAGAVATPSTERITSTAEQTATWTAVDGTKTHLGMVFIYTETTAAAAYTLPLMTPLTRVTTRL